MVTFGWVHYADVKIISSSDLLKKVGHIFMSLCSAYKDEGKMKEYLALKDFIMKLPFNSEYKSSLINMGYRNSKGEELP